MLPQAFSYFSIWTDLAAKWCSSYRYIDLSFALFYCLKYFYCSFVSCCINCVITHPLRAGFLLCRFSGFFSWAAKEVLESTIVPFRWGNGGILHTESETSILSGKTKILCYSCKFGILNKSDGASTSGCRQTHLVCFA